MKVLLSVFALSLTFFVSAQAEAAQCKVELENGRGRLLDTFTGWGYSRADACREANRDCRRAIRSGYYRARILNCNIVQDRRIVLRSCQANLRGPRGRLMRSFWANAQGPIRTGVKARACQKARRKCMDFKRRNGRYRASCEVERRAGRDRDIPRYPRRGGLIVLDA
ncbi:MAG: hypothetical protein QF441_08425 [Bacteriovoracaceae bacterium]|nr:hypothetical protein [Halobacteriovoraceae bacterium]MDP7320620.1 hypothetical protein [Bacteriovoracaceae bacterium]